MQQVYPAPLTAPAAVTLDTPQDATAPFAPVRLPAERKPSWATLAALATVTGATALALGGWALLDGDGAPARPSGRELALEKAISVLANPRAERIPLSGSAGSLTVVVDERGDAVLTFGGLGRATGGRTYQAWVAPPGSARLVSAGLFDGSEQFVPLGRPVMPGARVSVTAEASGGARAPSRVPRLTALRG